MLAKGCTELVGVKDAATPVGCSDRVEDSTRELVVAEVEERSSTDRHIHVQLREGTRVEMGLQCGRHHSQRLERLPVGGVEDCQTHADLADEQLEPEWFRGRQRLFE
jgi:hypothetical protein